MNYKKESRLIEGVGPLLRDIGYYLSKKGAGKDAQLFYAISERLLSKLCVRS